MNKGGEWKIKRKPPILIPMSSQFPLKLNHRLRHPPTTQQTTFIHVEESRRGTSRKRRGSKDERPTDNDKNVAVRGCCSWCFLACLLACLWSRWFELMVPRCNTYVLNGIVRSDATRRGCSRLQCGFLNYHNALYSQLANWETKLALLYCLLVSVGSSGGCGWVAWMVVSRVHKVTQLAIRGGGRWRRTNVTGSTLFLIS